MSQFSLSNLALSMSYRVSAKEVGKLVDKLGIEPSDNLAVTTTESVNVAALQIVARTYDSLADYIVDMNLYIADAVNRRAQLVCMPAYAGLLPITIAPQITDYLPLIVRQPEFEPVDEDEDENNAADSPAEIDPESFYELLSYCSDYTFEAYFETMSSLAAAHRICLMAGTALYFDDHELCHRALLFGQDGELIGMQDKATLTPFERAMHLNQASEIKVFETPVGPVAILIGSDAYCYEPARIAKNLGAQILLCPTLFDREYTPIDSTLGLNLRVQENKVYGVQSSFVGDSGFGFMLEGGGRIYVPNEMLAHKNGVAAKSSGRSEPDIATMQLSIDKLDDLNPPYTSDVNPEFLDKYIDRLY